MKKTTYLYVIRVEGIPLPHKNLYIPVGNQTEKKNKMAHLVTFNETTFEFSFNKEKTFNYDGKGTNKVEHYDVLLNGVKSIYYVQFDTTLNEYTLWSGTPDKSGGITHREVTSLPINEISGFPINVVCDIVKEIDTNWVR